jgi:hypothetical protein
MTHKIDEYGRHEIKASPQCDSEGDFVQFDEENGGLYINSYEGMTTLSKEAALDLATILLAWAKAPSITDIADADLIALLCNGPITIVERMVAAGRLAALADRVQKLEENAATCRAHRNRLHEERNAIETKTIEQCAQEAEKLSKPGSSLPAAIRALGKAD